MAAERILGWLVTETQAVGIHGDRPNWPMSKAASRAKAAQVPEEVNDEDTERQPSTNDTHDTPGSSRRCLGGHHIGFGRPWKACGPDLPTLTQWSSPRTGSDHRRGQSGRKPSL